MSVAFAVTGVSPSQGSYMGGMQVTVTGQGFQSGMEVMMGESSCTEVNVASDGNSLTCKTPPASKVHRVDNMGQHPSKYS